MDDDMRNDDWWTIEAMRKRGGSFVQALSEAASRADPINLHKIKTTWPEYWADYLAEGKRMKKDWKERGRPAL